MEIAFQVDQGIGGQSRGIMLGQGFTGMRVKVKAGGQTQSWITSQGLRQGRGQGKRRIQVRRGTGRRVQAGSSRHGIRVRSSKQATGTARQSVAQTAHGWSPWERDLALILGFPPAGTRGWIIPCWASTRGSNQHAAPPLAPLGRLGFKSQLCH